MSRSTEPVAEFLDLGVGERCPQRALARAADPNHQAQGAAMTASSQRDVAKDGSVVHVTDSVRRGHEMSLGLGD